jgi:hypothetical protein
MTACLTSSPKYASAVSFILTRIMEDISSGENVSVLPLNSTCTLGLPFLGTTLKGKCLMSACRESSDIFRPMRRFASKMLFRGFIAHWLFAESPMIRSVSVKATHDGVVRFPWSLGIISHECVSGLQMETPASKAEDQALKDCNQSSDSGSTCKLSPQ